MARGCMPRAFRWDAAGPATAPRPDMRMPFHRRRKLRDFCNLGYAEGCERFPQERVWIRYGSGRGRFPGDKKNFTGGHIQIRYVCERDHRPVEHGTLKFDAVAENWLLRHSDDRVQRMAECFMATYVEKRKKPQVNPAVRADTKFSPSTPNEQRTKEGYER